MKRPVLILLSIALICGGWLVYSLATRQRYVMPPLLTGDVRKLEKTEFVPAIQSPHAGKNLVWCGTAQLAWNKLMVHVGGKVELFGAPREANGLNERVFDEKMIDEASSFSALMKNTADVAAARSALQGKFGRDVEIKLLPDELEPGAIATYSMLMKNLEFRKLLHSLDEPLDFKGSRVAAFGLKEHAKDHDRLAGQIRIHDYAGPDDFILELFTLSEADELLIAKVPSQKTLLETTRAVLARRNKATNFMLAKTEPLLIPKLNFEYTATFPALENKAILNKSLQGNDTLAHALQTIRFKLDERGAVLKSEAAKEWKSASALSRGDPRTFIVDKAFLILMLRRDAATPYFAMWVENAEMLVGKK